MTSAKSSVPNGAAKVSVPFGVTLPHDTPEYMAPAYYGCLLWALRKKEILDQFIAATGREIPRARDPITEMVDKACEFDPYLEFVKAFVPWFNEWIWGSVDGPDANQA